MQPFHGGANRHNVGFIASEIFFSDSDVTNNFQKKF